MKAAASCFLGQGHHARGDYRQAIAVLDRTAGWLKGELGHQLLGMTFPPGVHARVFLAISLAEVGEFADARARGEEALRIAEALDHPYGLFHVWWGLGITDLLKEDTDSAITALERALSIAQARSLPLMVNATLGYLGHAYARAGRLQVARGTLETALAQSTAMSFVCWHSLTTVFLADACLRAGQRPDAERISLQAVTLARHRAHRGNEAHALRLLADSLALGDSLGRSRAEATYREALELAERLDMRPLMAHCHRGLAVLYQRTGDRANATAELATAATIFRELNMPLSIAQAETAHDEVG